MHVSLRTNHLNLRGVGCFFRPNFFYILHQSHFFPKLNKNLMWEEAVFDFFFSLQVCPQKEYIWTAIMFYKKISLLHKELNDCFLTFPLQTDIFS